MASKRTRSTRKRKRKRPKKKSKSQGTSKRFPGLIWRLILFALINLPLAFINLVPLPQNTHFTRPQFEDFSSLKKRPATIKAKKTLPKGKKSKVFKKEVAVPVEKIHIRPKVAIIIDDMGYDPQLDKKFILLDSNLTFAFLPYAPFTKRLAQLAHSKGADILVHVPMEPENKGINPGPGLITTTMNDQRLLNILDSDIAAVPFAIGVNNHMGSLFTADRIYMEKVLIYLKKRGLFFVDSRTTSRTVVCEVAQKVGIKYSQRSVFLDHSFSKGEIKRQIKRLVKIASKKGQAIAIGHPHKITFEVLKTELPIIKKYVQIVPIHTLVH